MRSRIFYGWVIVATLAVVNFAVHATGTLNLGLFIVPMGDDLGISRGVFGWLTTSRSLAGGLSGPFAGRLVDRLGPRLLIPASALITGLCLIAMGMTQQVWPLFLVFALIGLVGLSTPGGGLLTSVPVAKWFVRKRGKALAAAMIGMGIGPIVFVPVSQLLIDGVGWRVAWVVLACISMGIIIPLALLFLRRQPEDMGLLPDGDAEAPSEADAVRPVRDFEAAWTVGEALRTRTFWMLLSTLVLSGFAQGGGVHRIPYMTGIGFEPGLVALAISCDAAGATVTILLSGLLLDRFPARFVAAGALACFGGGMLLMLLASNAFHLFASTTLFGFGAGTNMVCQTYLWASYYGRASLGSIRGIALPAMLVASAAGAPVFGYIYDFTGGYELAWQIAIGIYVVAVLIMLGAPPPGTRSARLPDVRSRGTEKRRRAPM